MTKHRFTQLRHNTVACLALALFVALGGTSYASVKHPSHKVVGPHSGSSAAAPSGAATTGVTHSANLVYWAYLSATGAVLSESPKLAVTASHPGTGAYLVYFNNVDLTNCAVVGSVTSDYGSLAALPWAAWSNSSITGGTGFPLPPGLAASPLASYLPPTSSHVIPVLTTTVTAGGPSNASFGVVATCSPTNLVTTPLP